MTAHERPSFITRTDRIFCLHCHTPSYTFTHAHMYMHAKTHAGPDWPTSVLTGILGLPLLPMLLGTLPVALLIAPCVLAGGFQLMLGNDADVSAAADSSSSSWEAWASVGLTGAAVAQMVALTGAAHCIEQVASRHWKELAAEEDDQEVLEVDRLKAVQGQRWRRLTDWQDPYFPLTLKVQSDG